MELMNVNIPDWSDLAYWRPELIMCCTFLVALIGDLVVRGRRPWVAFAISTLGLVTAGSYAVAALDPGVHGIMGSMVVVDGLAAWFRMLFIFAGLVTVLFAWTSEEIMGKTRENKGEFFALTVLLTAAACVMAEASNLLMLFLSMEAVGLVSYVMAGYMRTSLRSTEASLKYVIFGAVSSGIMLYGLSLLYGMTGAMQFTHIREALMTGNVEPFGLLVAVVLIIVGMSYKIAAVPFHYWAPDVYEGAPTPVAAIFSVGPKAAGFALMIRFFYTTLAAGPDPAASADLIAQIDWPLLMSVMAAATMTLGNIVALRQTNVKRLLAYSSIAHAGYILMGFVMLSSAGLQAILFYLLVYTIMNLGAFLYVVAMNNHLKSEELSDWVGLGMRAPWAGAFMVIFLTSLVGLPPFAGFAAKLFLFKAVIERGMYWLVIVAGLNTVVSLMYYFKVVKAMFLTTPEEGADTSPLKVHWLQYLILGGLAVPTLLLGLFFGQFTEMALRAVEMMTG